MTRRKKTRKTGPLAPSKRVTPEWEKSKPDASGAHAGKGRKPGSRFNVAPASKAQVTAQANVHDPRLGSKKPITLMAADAVAPVVPSFDRKAAMAELAAIENDERLQDLLDRLDEGDELSVAESRYVDERTTRFEQLAELLGLDLNDDEDDDD